MTHPQNIEAAQAALHSVALLKDERASPYGDILFAVLGVTAQRALEKLMAIRPHEYQSDFARKYFAEGLDEGLAKGLDEGLAKGLDAGLIAVLTARGLKPSAELLSRVHACRDPVQLTQWLRAAASAESLDEVFGDV